MNHSFERLRAKTGQNIRAARKKAGCTGEQLAQATGISQSKISKIENGLLLPSPEDIISITTSLKLKKDEANRLISQVEDIRTETGSLRISLRSGLTQKQIDVDKIESRSSFIRIFQAYVIPGLLQTKEYAKRIFSSSNIGDKKDIDNAIEARIIRQRILVNQNKNFEFIIMDSALKMHHFFELTVFSAQLDHLIAFHNLPNIKIMIQKPEKLQEIPMETDFVIYDRKIVRVEGSTTEANISGRSDVQTFEENFERFSRGALQKSQALAYIRKCKYALHNSTS